MDKEQSIRERFFRDIHNHKMEVLLDNGLYRHLKFSDGTFNMAFQIITIPGRLWYCGDMGYYTFCRLEDMFEFFRTRKPGHLQINPSYWSQKLESYDRDGVERYSGKETRKLVLKHCSEWPQDVVQMLLDEVIFEDGSEDGRDVSSSLYNFEYEAEDGEKYSLEDCHELICHEYTFRFLWCCCALVWGIDQYDGFKEREVPRVL